LRTSAGRIGPAASITRATTWPAWLEKIGSRDFGDRLTTNRVPITPRSAPSNPPRSTPRWRSKTSNFIFLSVARSDQAARKIPPEMTR